MPIAMLSAHISRPIMTHIKQRDLADDRGGHQIHAPKKMPAPIPATTAPGRITDVG